MDILFLIDNLVGIDLTTYHSILQTTAAGIFAYDVAQNNNLANQTVRIAAMTFTTSTSILFNLNTDRGTVNSLLGAFGLAGGVRNEGAALESAVKYLYGNSTGQNMRPNAQKIIILFSQGLSNDDPAPRCNFLKTTGVSFYVVGLESSGTGTGTFFDNEASKTKQLKLIASGPLQTNYIPVQVLAGNTFFISQAAQSVARRLRGNAPVECHLYGNSHITTFDGNDYTFPGYGDFYLVAPCDIPTTGDLSVQVRLVPCDQLTPMGSNPAPPQATSGRSCAQAFAISMFGSDTVEVDWRPASAGLFVYRNGVIQDRVSSISLSSGGVSIRQRAVGGFEVDVLIGEHFVSLEFLHFQTGATARIRLGEAQFGRVNTVGLCGKYDSCPLNDYYHANETMVSTRASPQAIYDQFATSWRVAPGQNSFVTAAGEYYQMAIWKPQFPDLSADTSADAKTSCFGAGSGSFLANCMSDVTVTGSKGVSQVFRSSFFFACLDYCSNGLFPTSLFSQSFQQLSTMCDLTCKYKFSLQYIPTNTNLQTVYSSTTLPPVDLRGQELPNAFFLVHPGVTRGGSYTFQRMVSRPDFCGSTQLQRIPSRNITVNVACLPIPTTSAGADIQVYYGTYGYPIIEMNGAIAFPTGNIFNFQSANLVISWALVGFIPIPGNPNITLSSIPILGVNSLNPRWTPTAPGVYTLQFSASDGCSVTRDTVMVEVLQRCCTPLVETLPVSTVFWRGTTFQFPVRGIIVNGTSVNTPQSPPPPGSGSFSPSNLPYPLSDNRSLNPRSSALQYSWSILGKKASPTSGYMGALTPVSSTQYLYSNVLQGPTYYSNVSTTNTNVVSNNTVSGTTSDRLPSGSPLKYVIDNEANFFVTTRTVVTSMVTQEVDTFVPAVTESCVLTLNSPTTSSPTFLPSIPAGLTDTFNTYAKACTGFYTVQKSTSIAGYSSFCAVNDTIDVQVSCNLPPVSLLVADSKVNFDYNSVQFPVVTFDATGSFDPANNPTVRRWTVMSAPASSNVRTTVAASCPVGTNACSFRPDLAGAYTLLVETSNGCQIGSTTTILVAQCGASVTGAITTTAFTRSTPAPVDVALAATTTSPGTPFSSWSLVTSPTIPAALQNFVPPSNIAGSTLHAFFGGTYTVKLSVADGCTQTSVTGNVNVNCANTITANAGTAQIVNFDTALLVYPLVTLSGAGTTSTDPTFILSYTWTFDSVPANSLVNTAPTSGIGKTFTPDTNGVYVLRLTVNDGCAYSQSVVSVTANCALAVPNPVTTTNLTGNALFGRLFTLTASSDLSVFDILAIRWAVVAAPSGASTSIINPTAPVASFVPNQAGSYVFMLVMCNNCSVCNSVNTTVNVDCVYPFTIGTSTPQTVTWSKGAWQRVVVTGAGSNLQGESINALTYVWSFIGAPATSTYAPSVVTTLTNSSSTSSSSSTSGPNVTLTTTTTVTFTEMTKTYLATLIPFNSQDFDFFPGFFHPDVLGVYTIQLSVADGCRTQTAVTTVTAACNTQPSANINAPQNVSVNGEHITVVQLDGSASFDADGDGLTYTWNLTSGAALLLNPASSVATLQIANPGAIVVTLTVSDGCSTSTTQSTIMVDMQCTSVTTATDSVTIAYSYLPRVTETVVLYGDDGNFVPGNTIARSTRNAAAAIDPAGIQSYRGYDAYYSTLEGRATQLQCDTLYTWTLVQYTEATATSPVAAFNPCFSDEYASTSLCINVATAANTDSGSDSTPVQKRGYFIAIMVIIAAIVVAIGTFVYFKCIRKPSSFRSPGRVKTDVMARDEPVQMA